MLFFVHLETRRITIARITRHPTGEWMEQIACSATQETWGYLNPCRYVLHDRGKKFCASFRPVLTAAATWMRRWSWTCSQSGGWRISSFCSSRMLRIGFVRLPTTWEAVECDLTAAHRSIQTERPGMPVFQISAKTSQGMDRWLEELCSFRKRQ